MKNITVYGSLKNGYHLHYLIEGSKFLGETKVKGVLYSMGSYPALVDEAPPEGYDDLHTAEKYRVSDDIYDMVKNVELNAGYKEVVVDGSVVFYAGDKLADICRTSKEIISKY